MNLLGARRGVIDADSLLPNRHSERHLGESGGDGVRRTVILAIGAGGALGAVMRYLLSGWVQGLGGARFPWGTLTVNVLGSFLLGLLMATVLDHPAPGPLARAFWGIGLLGGFTTYSTFSYETIALISGGDWTAGGTNLAANLVLGLGAALAGLRLGSL